MQRSIITLRIYSSAVLKYPEFASKQKFHLHVRWKNLRSYDDKMAACILNVTHVCMWLHHSGPLLHSACSWRENCIDFTGIPREEEQIHRYQDTVQPAYMERFGAASLSRKTIYARFTYTYTYTYTGIETWRPDSICRHSLYLNNLIGGLHCTRIHFYCDTQ